jgi:hypothetical protein
MVPDGTGASRLSPLFTENPRRGILGKWASESLHSRKLASGVADSRKLREKGKAGVVLPAFFLLLSWGVLAVLLCYLL